MHDKRRHVADIKPLRPLVPHRINKGVLKVLLLLVLMELDPTPTQDRSIVGSRVRFQVKKIMKEGDRRKDAKKGFT
jgi:hypothetical protein